METDDIFGIIYLSVMAFLFLVVVPIISAIVKSKVDPYGEHSIWYEMFNFKDAELAIMIPIFGILLWPLTICILLVLTIPISINKMTKCLLE